MSGRLKDLDVDETSGVDYPAHLHDGWLLMKGRDMGNEAVSRLAELVKASTVECEKCGYATDASSEHCSKCGAVLPKNEEGAKTETEKAKRLTQGRIERLRTIRDGISGLIDEAGGETVSEHEEHHDDEAQEDELLKAVSPEVRAVIEKRDEELAALRKQADEDREELKKERIEKADREAFEKASGWTNLPVNPAEFGPVLRELRMDKPDVAKAIEGILDSAEAQAKESALFTSVGKGRASADSAEGQLTAMAKAIAKDKGISEPEGYDEAIQTEEGKRLFEQSQREKAGR